MKRSVVARKLARVDRALDKAIEKAEIPGAVVLARMTRDSELLEHASVRGHAVLRPERIPMTRETVFDLASLTKPMATTTALLRLVHEGALALDDPVAKVLPHFAERDKEDLEALLRHNAEFNNATVRKIPVNIPKGHVSFHHCRTYHGSGGNLSPNPRRALSLHLQDGANEYREFHLSDGTKVAYNHDVLVRTTPDGRPDYADPAFCPVIWAR